METRGPSAGLGAGAAQRETTVGHRQGTQGTDFFLPTTAGTHPLGVTRGALGEDAPRPGPGGGGTGAAGAGWHGGGGTRRARAPGAGVSRAGGWVGIGDAGTRGARAPGCARTGEAPGMGGGARAPGTRPARAARTHPRRPLACHRRGSRDRQQLFPDLLLGRRHRRPGRAALPFRFREPERRAGPSGCPRARAGRDGRRRSRRRFAPRSRDGSRRGPKDQKWFRGGAPGTAVTGTPVPGVPWSLALPSAAPCPASLRLTSLSPHPPCAGRGPHV